VPNYRTLATVTTEYFSQHPDEIDDFLTELFADYAEDGDSATLHSMLDIVAQAKNIRQRIPRPLDSSPS
jgi:DNA-binding phage protein